MDAGLVNFLGEVKQVMFGWEGTGFQIVLRITTTTLVGLNITPTSIIYIQSFDNGNIWSTVWTK